MLDEVYTSPAVAELSQRSSLAIGVAPDAERSLGVAWRPLVDTHSDGSWTHSAAAEVRWLTVGPNRQTSALHRYSTKAEPLSFRTGMGPWSLEGNGLQASVLDGRAFFAWIDETKLVGARASDTASVVLVPSGVGAPLIELRPHANELELLLLHSSPSVAAFRLRCQ